ncbi:hypothetical protein PN456_11980 [Nodularia spumigena CS-586/05]|nr:hypothetical protein [Nodularia spumigena]MDB9321416.1 hypothetical protein [Nodularia spumigena CS-591/07A]MDB9343502.1 hypothetical protein [Nodularia spumigena CS-588/06]MDB9369667.1 hypothetical protein [Nodularia spumigena CS-586/05]
MERLYKGFRLTNLLNRTVLSQDLRKIMKSPTTIESFREFRR